MKTLQPRDHRAASARARVARRARKGMVALLFAVLGASCGPRRLSVVAPLADATERARTLERGTVIDAPLRIRFSWHLNESGSRVDGVGVARVQPPYRARLDLFLENGETVVTAALVDDELRLPHGSREDVLPPVELMWGVLGVFRPHPGADLVGGERLEGDAERLRYRTPGGVEIHYEIDAEGALRAVELLRGDAVVEWVRVAREEAAPSEATYRNLAEYRELRIVRDSLARVDSFDPRIWDPRSP